jgi:hypothetical protein
MRPDRIVMPSPLLDEHLGFVEEDVRGLLTDVATANTEAANSSQTPSQHQAVAEIVRRILAGKNGLRH